MNPELIHIADGNTACPWTPYIYRVFKKMFIVSWEFLYDIILNCLLAPVNSHLESY